MTQAVARIGRPQRLAIDLAAVVNLVGTLGKYLGLAAIFPIPFALGYGEPFLPFVVAGAVTSGLGLALERLTSESAGKIGLREGFLVVALTWLLAAAFASIPYLFEGGSQLSNPLDAYFEGMSGFTTTGASVVTDYDAINRSLGIWRQFTQWLGGMGIIVLAIAVLPRLRVGGRQLWTPSCPGPRSPRSASASDRPHGRLWFLYVALTAIEVLLLTSLWVVGVDDLMTPYEALANAFSTMPTGGFATRADKAAAFSAEAQWILVLFMAIAGANFALMYRALVRRRPRLLARDEEFRLYVAIVVAASAAIAVMLWGTGSSRARPQFARRRSRPSRSYDDRIGDGQLRALATASPPCALRPHVRRGLGRLDGRIDQAGAPSAPRKVAAPRGGSDASPEFVMPIRLNGAPVDERTVRAVAAFVLLYVGLWAVGASVIAIDSAISDVGLGTLDSLAASATTLGNIGTRLRHRGAVRLVRRVRRRLQGHHDRPHVGRPARDRPRRRAADAPLLAPLRPPTTSTAAAIEVAQRGAPRRARRRSAVAVTGATAST